MSIPTGRKLLDPEAILSQARLSAGMAYADFGAGMLGYFVFPAARIVGEGTPVYAVDILKGALEGIESRARLENARNIKTVWGDIEKLGGVQIPPQSLDVITMVNIASVIEKSPSVLEEAKRLLKDDGKLIIVGWREDATMPIAPPKEKRVSAHQMKTHVAQAELVLMKEFDAGAQHWGLLIRRKPFKNYPVKIIG